ncbi:MAG: two-component system response regulator [Elusimicrobia bacterium]|nr:MAG: two-component system response regulator [Elusimicrobiota bacterium]
MLGNAEVGMEKIVADETLKKKILVADDDAEIRSLVSDVLSDLGYLVVTVSDGAMLYRSVPSEKPDLILSDLDMPGLSGGTAQALLRTSPETKDIPIIFMTGQSPERQARLVEFRPDTRILYKPLNLKELAIAVEEELNPSF